MNKRLDIMANKKATMTELRAIIRELSKGVPVREIERKLGISRRSISVYRDRAVESGHSFSALVQMEESSLSAILCRESAHRNRDEERYAFLQEHLPEYAERMKRRYMTYEIVYYQEYSRQTDNPYGYTQFKNILKEYQSNHDYKYHNVYDPDGEMQVDFAGDNLWVIDRGTGEAQKAHVLVCILPYSSMCYVTAMLETKMEFFFKALSDAVQYFGGVPEVVKSDNMTQWVKRYDRYDPSLNDAAIQWGLHYGTEIENCRSRHPRDKGAVEGLVSKVYNYFYSRLQNYGPKGEHEEFFSIRELNRRLLELTDDYCNIIRKGHMESRRQKYEEEELPHMLPLPPSRYMFRYEKKFKVTNNYHVAIDGYKYYSIPYQYVGQEAKALYDAETIEVWIGGNRVCTHQRSYKDGYVTEPSHMPENHRAYANSRERNAAYYIRMAGHIGPQTAEVIGVILKSKPFVQQSYKACDGILNMARKYGNDKLESVCARIVPKAAANYKMVKNMVEHNMEQRFDEIGPDQSYIPENENVRGAEAYT